MIIVVAEEKEEKSFIATVAYRTIVGESSHSDNLSERQFDRTIVLGICLLVCSPNCVIFECLNCN